MDPFTFDWNVATLAAGVLLAQVANVPQVLWEWHLHRRTQRTVREETAALLVEVRSNVQKAETDREAIMGRVDATRAAVVDAVERGAAERIAEAQAQLEAQAAEEQERLEAIARQLQEREASLKEQVEEALKSREMARRGAVGNASQEAQRAVSANAPKSVREVEALIEAKFGADKLDFIRRTFPNAWSSVEDDPERWDTYLRFGLGALAKMAPGAGGQAPAASGALPY